VLEPEHRKRGEARASVMNPMARRCAATQAKSSCQWVRRDGAEEDEEQYVKK